MKEADKTDVLFGIVRPLLRWYAENARPLPWRMTPDPYRVWVSEIMLQQTRVEAVKPYYARFLAAFPDVAALAAAGEDTYLKLWEGLGYYSRVRNMHRCAETVVRDFGGEFPRTVEALRTLPGIGSYTAGAVASIAFGVPAPAVDGNVLRVVTRLTADARCISDDVTKRAVEAEIANVIPRDAPGDFNQSLIELGATVCIPGGVPQCDVCPVANLCLAHRDGREENFPVKRARTARKLQDRTVFLVTDGERFLLCKRPEHGLLAGLYEFPGTDGHLPHDAAFAFVERLTGQTPTEVTPLPPATHVFTHVEWHMTGFCARVASLPEGENTVAARPDELQGKYALPSAFRVYRDCAMRWHKTDT